MSACAWTPEDERRDTLPPEPVDYYTTPEIPCFCDPSVPWSQRRYDGSSEEFGYEQRSCLMCGASLSRGIR